MTSRIRSFVLAAPLLIALALASPSTPQPWETHQRRALELAAANAESALARAGSELERLAAAQRLASARQASVQPVRVTSLLTGQEEFCLTCHLGIEEISPSHPVQVVGCVVCHGGDGSALDQRKAHASLRGGGDPAQLEVAGKNCGRSDCHGGDGIADMVARVQRSLPATYATGISLIRYSFGLQSLMAPLYAVRPVAQPEGSTSATALGGLPCPSESSEAPDARFRESCLNRGCHLWERARYQRYFYRGEGCAACHVAYGLEGTYQGADATIDRSAPGHPALHRLSTAIPYSTCNSCHNRGYYDPVILIYHNRTDLSRSALDAIPAEDRRYIESYHPIGQYTRCEWVLDCVDCHTANETMGYGDIGGLGERGQVVQCRTCHGTSLAGPDLQQVTSASDPALRQARLSGRYELQVGDWAPVTTRGETLGNVRLEGTYLVLTMKATGVQYTVPLVQGSGCLQDDTDQASRSCHVCHDDSGRR